MAKARNWLADLLTRTGRSIFQFISKHEEKSRLARWIKLPLLGVVVSAIGVLSTGSVCVVNCYVPIDTVPYIENAEVTPNPTAGADSVTVKATAEIHEERDVADTVFINKAISIMKRDTTEMQATDGAFDEKTEEFQARLYVGDLEPGKVGIEIEVFNNIKDMNGKTLDLEVTEGE